MKKLLMALSILALTGAGCANSTETQKAEDTSAPETETQQSDTTKDDFGVVEVETSTKDGGGTIQYTTKPTTKSGNEEDDVPVTDIYLGEAQVKVNMESGNFFFKPNIIKAKAGNAVELTFTKVDGTHDFVIDGTNANFTVTEGTKKIFTAPSKPGSYPFYCSIGKHRAMGMFGTLIVE